MVSNAGNKKLLIKNSIALYLRMILSIVIGLYTSRVVLEVLGVDDYGVYNIVGGVVGLTSFINASMSSASSRFLTYELGSGDTNRLTRTFETAVTIHIFIAVLVLIICESVGLWFVNCKLVLPENSLEAANWVFQMSIFSTCLTIVQVPYNAVIMAHERMNVYAYIEIFNSVMKLGIVYLLLVLPGNKLELYSSLHAVVTILIFLFYLVYGRKHFKECHLRLLFDKTYLKPMLSYSGWDLFGNLSVTAKQQGGSVVLNLFYGVVANASAGIANVVNGTILGFSQIVMTAFRPQIIKNYSGGAMEDFLQLLHLSFKVVLIFYAFISIPAFICMNNMLSIWLENPPEYSALFCRILLISGFFNLFSIVFITGLHATGKIKSMSMLGLCCNLMTLIASYIGYKIGAQIGWLYYCFCIFNAIIAFGCLIILKSQVNQLKASRFIADLLMVLICYAIIYIGASAAYTLVSGRFASICITCICSVVLSAICCVVFLLNRAQRKRVLTMVKAKLGLKY